MSTRIVYTAGVWDLFHFGHLKTLKFASNLGDRLCVGVITDEGCFAYKGYKPTIPTEQRFEIILALDFVDSVYIQDGTDPSTVLKMIYSNLQTGDKIVAMTHGADWLELKEGMDTLIELGVPLVLTPYNKEWGSSTMIKEKIRNDI
jgi:glycerol-3-phosphate cytidylyltransferase